MNRRRTRLLVSIGSLALALMASALTHGRAAAQTVCDWGGCISGCGGADVFCDPYGTIGCNPTCGGFGSCPGGYWVWCSGESPAP